MTDDIRLVMIVFFFALSFPNLTAQEASCRLIGSDGTPISYASVYFPGLRRGMLTDEKGDFTINLEGSSETNEVTFSCLNYLPETLTVGALLKLNDTDCQIILKETDYRLETTEIVAERINLKRFNTGVTDGNDDAWFDFRSDRNNPLEIGTAMKVRKRSRVDNVNIRIDEVEVDSFLIEISLYDYAKGGKNVGKMLLKKRIMRTLNAAPDKQTLSVDLTDQNIWVDDDFLVTFRMLRTGDSEGFVKMAARTKRGKGISTVGDGRWSPSLLYPSIWSELSYPTGRSE